MYYPSLSPHPEKTSRILKNSYEVFENFTFLVVFSELKRKGFVFLLLTFEIPIKFKTHVHMRLTATKEHTGISLQKKILHWFREEKKNMVVYFR